MKIFAISAILFWVFQISLFGQSKGDLPPAVFSYESNIKIDKHTLSQVFISGGYAILSDKEGRAMCDFFVSDICKTQDHGSISAINPNGKQLSGHGNVMWRQNISMPQFKCVSTSKFEKNGVEYLSVKYYIYCIHKWSFTKEAGVKLADGVVSINDKPLSVPMLSSSAAESTNEDSYEVKLAGSLSEPLQVEVIIP